jgi:hypothetical protein
MCMCDTFLAQHSLLSGSMAMEEAPCVGQEHCVGVGVLSGPMAMEEAPCVWALCVGMGVGAGVGVGVLVALEGV